jgi:hypothetical protein
MSDGTAVGSGAAGNATGNDNITAIGYNALKTIDSVILGAADDNTALGNSAGLLLETGSYNTLLGSFAMSGGTTFASTTAVGARAGYLITTGSKNTLLGRYSGNQGGLDIRTASNYIVLSDGDGNPRAYWNGADATFNGNVGIGTTSPTIIGGYTTLKINNGTTGALLDLAQADVVRGRLGVNSTEFTIETSGTIPILFAPAGSEAMRVDGGARLLVGVQTPSVSSSQSGEFYGATTYGYVFVNTTAANYPMCVWNQATTGTRSLVAFMQGASATVIGSIVYNGTNTVYNTTSDYRLKTVIGAVTDAGQRIDALQPVEYTWNSNGTHARGFLAHQFQEVYADSVTGAKDAVDADGKPAYQQMQASTSEVIADLVAELQSLRARVTQLESKP